MRTVRKLASLAAVGALALTTVSCAESERSDDGEGGEGGGESTFTFGAAGAPEMFDPLYATDGETFRVTRQMFQGLLGIEPGTAEVVPELATEWTSNEEGTEWTFTLRDDVTFHDGEPFNAEAVCANFERMYDQNEAGQVAAEYWGYVMGSFANDPDNSLYQGCEASDEFEAVVTISRSTSGFPTMLTLASLAMQSPAAMEAGDANGIETQGEGFSFPEYAQNPVGTGPYQFVEYDQSVGTVTLEAYDDFWGDAPASSNLAFRVIPDESTRRQELEAGSIDGYDLPNPADWPGLEESGNSVEVRDPFNIFYLGLNPEANPQLKDLKVRQALYHALDREQLVQTQLPEGAEVATQFMPSTVSGYNSTLEPYAYDPDQARQLLQEAGAEGMTLTFAYPTEVSRPYMPDPQQLFEALRTNLEDVGIKVDVKTASWNGGYLDNVTARQVRRLPARLDGRLRLRVQLHRHVLRQPQGERLRHRGHALGQAARRRPPGGRRDRRRGREGCGVRGGQPADHGGVPPGPADQPLAARARRGTGGRGPDPQPADGRGVQHGQRRWPVRAA